MLEGGAALVEKESLGGRYGQGLEGLEDLGREIEMQDDVKSSQAVKYLKVLGFESEMQQKTIDVVLTNGRVYLTFIQARVELYMLETWYKV